MKKRLSRFLYAITALVLVAGCSKDSDKTLDGVPGTYEGSNVTITVNGSMYSGGNAKVEVTGTVQDDMTFKIYNAVLGQAE